MQKKLNEKQFVKASIWNQSMHTDGRKDGISKAATIAKWQQFNVYQEFQIDNIRTENRMSNAKNRYQDCRICAKEIENLYCFSSSSTHNLSDIESTINTISHNSHPEGIESQDGFTLQTLLEKDNQINEQIIHQLTSFLQFTFQLDIFYQSNKQKMSQILLNIAESKR
ncbi:MAG: hypothetical protein EZS28_028098 [Streblomastix strix]|uniref:Uncharacterized protein n=1 Tax=Streblomastix strix TaxID=222440 RepID=A0A5J4V069_9EUKA|nr:MAG: hypothetical protein EZS28_028098 [Streblomastix strix]